MMNNPDERRRRIMAAVAENRWDDVPIEVLWVILDGLTADLAGSAGRPPLPVYPRGGL